MFWDKWLLYRETSDEWGTATVFRDKAVASETSFYRVPRLEGAVFCDKFYRALRHVLPCSQTREGAFS